MRQILLKSANEMKYYFMNIFMFVKKKLYFHILNFLYGLLFLLNILLHVLKNN